MNIWPVPTELPPAVQIAKLPSNPSNHEESPL